MIRTFSIVMAVTVLLTLLVAWVVPAGAVVAGTLTVDVAEPLAWKSSNYTIEFVNSALLLGDTGDYIDVVFPSDTNVETPGVTAVTVTHAASRENLTADPTAVSTSVHVQGVRTIRITVTGGDNIPGSYWVRVVLQNVKNPTAGWYELQVGTSNAGSVASEEYEILLGDDQFSVPLYSGWNLIAVPLVPNYADIETVLSDILDDVLSVWYYDAAAATWLAYAPGAPSDLATMEDGKAYWVRMKADASLLVQGSRYPPCGGPPVKYCYVAGWNMIGALSLEDIWASEYLWDAMLPWPSHNTYAVSNIFGFDVSIQQFYDTGWIPGQRDDSTWKEISPGDAELEPGRGYFMSFLGEACIIPPIP